MLKKILSISTLVLSLLIINNLQSFSVKAINYSDFKPGRIIDDIIFTNKSSMNIDQIQAFLNAKVPVCETRKQASFTGGSGTVYYAPYTCLKDYQENPLTGENNYGKYAPDNITPISVAGGKTAARIIWEVAQDYSINPQVLIVLLQKEQGLVTDTWPILPQFTKATGYLCPDTAPCSSSVAGFYKQVAGAGWQLRNDFNGIGTRGFWSPFTKGVHNILYNPNAACGTRTVNIENQATAVLYKYTPYTPNDAAIIAAPGVEVPCGAYGNRNFWRLFTSWFGSSTYISPSTFISNVPVTMTTPPVASPAVGQSMAYSFTLKNNFSNQIDIEAVGAVGRLNSPTNGLNKDFGWQGPVTLQPGESKTFNLSMDINDYGSLYVWPAVLFKGEFVQYNNWGSTIISRSPNFTLTEIVTINPSIPFASQSVSFTAAIKNNEPVAVRYNSLGIPVRHSGNDNYDAAWTNSGSLQPGEVIKITGNRVLDRVGAYTYWIANYTGERYAQIGSISQLNARPISPEFSVSAITLNPSTPILGQNVSATFSVTNRLNIPLTVSGVGVVGRYGTLTGLNRDIGWQGPVTFAAGETKTFSSGYVRTITETGAHYYWIGIFNNGGYIQYNNWGMTAISKAPEFSVSAITLNPSTPILGQNVSATFSVTNRLNIPLTVSGVGVVGRYGTLTGLNRDIGWQGPVTFAAGETKTFSSGYVRTITETGAHYYWIGIFNNGGYIQYNNWGMTAISKAP